MSTVAIVLVASLIDAAYSHTMKMCYLGTGTFVTFYGAVWDAHSYTTVPSGGVILNGGDDALNGTYAFTQTLTNTLDSPTGVNLSSYVCVTCTTTNSISYWQKVTISIPSSVSTATYDFALTTSSTEAEGCDFGFVTIVVTSS